MSRLPGPIFSKLNYSRRFEPLAPGRSQEFLPSQPLPVPEFATLPRLFKLCIYLSILVAIYPGCCLIYRAVGKSGVVPTTYVHLHEIIAACIFCVAWLIFALILRTHARALVLCGQSAYSSAVSSGYLRCFWWLNIALEGLRLQAKIEEGLHEHTGFHFSFYSYCGLCGLSFLSLLVGHWATHVVSRPRRSYSQRRRETTASSIGSPLLNSAYMDDPGSHDGLLDAGEGEGNSSTQVPEDRAGCCSRATFAFLDGVLQRGYRQPLEHADLDPLSVCTANFIIS